MFTSRKLDPRARLIFFTVWTAFAGIMSLVAVVFLVADLSGGNARATVVHVYSQQAYTIRFKTKDGADCETPHKWTARAEPVKAGDTFEVHYSAISPCDNVERSDDLFARFGFVPIPAIFVVVGLAVIARLRHQRKSSPAS